MAVKPIPDNYPRVSPYLIVSDVGKTIDFLKKVFNCGYRRRCRKF